MHKEKHEIFDMHYDSVLFVCSGNICRSPTAEGLMRHHAGRNGLDYLVIESAGTHGLHQGEPPDGRAISMALGRGIDLRDQRARKFLARDLDRFDLIFGMDEGHVHHMRSMASTDDHINKVHLFLEFTDQDARGVPDPYYGADDGFERVYDMIESGVQSLISKITA